MNETLPPQTTRCTCPKCGFSADQYFAYCPNCGTSTSSPSSTRPSSPSIFKILILGFLGLGALSMTGFSVVMSFIILAAGGGTKPDEWVLPIAVFPNILSAFCIGGILLISRTMR